MEGQQHVAFESARHNVIGWQRHSGTYGLVSKTVTVLGRVECLKNTLIYFSSCTGVTLIRISHPDLAGAELEVLRGAAEKKHIMNLCGCVCMCNVPWHCIMCVKEMVDAIKTNDRLTAHLRSGRLNPHTPSFPLSNLH